MKFIIYLACVSLYFLNSYDRFDDVDVNGRSLTLSALCLLIVPFIVPPLNFRDDDLCGNNGLAGAEVYEVPLVV